MKTRSYYPLGAVLIFFLLSLTGGGGKVMGQCGVTYGVTTVPSWSEPVLIHRSGEPVEYLYGLGNSLTYCPTNPGGAINNFQINQSGGKAMGNGTLYRKMEVKNNDNDWEDATGYDEVIPIYWNNLNSGLATTGYGVGTAKYRYVYRFVPDNGDPECITRTDEFTVTTVGSSISENQTICPGDTPDLLTSTVHTGDATVTGYSWKNHYTGDIVSTSDTYQPGALTDSRIYKLWVDFQVNGKSCVVPSKNVVTIKVNKVYPGYINGGMTICQGASTALSSQTLVATNTTPARTRT